MLNDCTALKMNTETISSLYLCENNYRVFSHVHFTTHMFTEDKATVANGWMCLQKCTEAD